MKKLAFLPWGDCIRRLLLSWLTAATALYLLLPGETKNLSELRCLQGVSLLALFLITVFGFAGLWLLSLRWNTAKWERWGLLAVFALGAAVSLGHSFAPMYLVLLLTCGAVLAVYARFGHRDDLPTPTTHPAKKWELAVVGVLALAFALFVSFWTVGRVRSFSAPSYDFGIFAQMFHSMKTTGLPVTTLERDGPLSHFMVHVSPIYYLMLPFYCLVPRPETIQVLQAAVLALSVIPMWKLAKFHGFTPTGRVLMCAMLLCFPVFSGGTGYDIHENCFLTVLLLSLLYGVDSGNGLLTALFALLTCMVKEDAPMYVAVVGLYQFLRGLVGQNRRWHLLSGLGLMAGAVCWFLAATGFLASQGDGVMNYRYDNFLFVPGGSMFTVILAVLKCPLKVVRECADPEKVGYLCQTVLPLLLLPLMTRRYERLVLLIPYILVNLMSDYTYQHNLFFQYGFGSGALLCYLAMVNLQELPKVELRRGLAAGTALVTAVTFAAAVVPVGLRYPRQAAQYHAYYQNLRDAFGEIPADASVAATTFYTGYLSQRETLYDVNYASPEHILDCEYVVADLNYENAFKKYATVNQSGSERFAAFLEKNGYVPLKTVGSHTVIYQRTTR